MKIISIVLLALALNNFIIIEGKISIKGNEPHTYTALTTADNKVYALTGKLTDEIKAKYQNKILKVRGQVVKSGNFPGISGFEVEKVIEIRDFN